MITIKNALKIHITLVIKLEDYIEKLPVDKNSGVKVISSDGLFRPVVKDNGFFVFTNHRPDSIHIISDKYGNFVVNTLNHKGTVLRLSLVPRDAKGKCLSVEGETLVGFGGNGIGYAITVPLSVESTEIYPYKQDLLDITDLFHVIVASGGVAEVIYITKNMGNGGYALKSPPTNNYPVRGTRLIPLYQVMGSKVPIPPSVNLAYILRNGILQSENLEESV